MCMSSYNYKQIHKSKKTGIRSDNSILLPLIEVQFKGKIRNPIEILHSIIYLVKYLHDIVRRKPINYTNNQKIVQAIQ